jgi:hypothetical protein
MTQDTFRFAYDEANAELNEILDRFEQLQARKDQIEKIVEALKPLLANGATTEATAPMQVTESTPFLVQQPMEEVHLPAIEVAPAPVAEPAFAAEESSDPFQRRIDNALRHGFGGRDSRVLSLGLNGLLTRA